MSDVRMPLVTAVWLREHLEAPDLVILDVRSVNDDPALDFSAGHIPGARHADYATAGWRTTVAGVPSQLPPADHLQALIGALGIGDTSLVVVVPAGRTAADVCNATRVYWTFRTVGHDRVSVLDGGYAAWTADPANPIATGHAVPPVPASFTVRLDTRWLADLAQVRAALASGAEKLLDARGRDQFEGTAKSAQARAAGTIPGSTHFPAADLYAGHLLTRDTLAAALAVRNIRPTDKAIVFCNTGHLASLGWFMLSEVMGGAAVRLYDGSMTEWSADPGRPLQTGRPDA